MKKYSADDLNFGCQQLKPNIASLFSSYNVRQNNRTRTARMTL